MNILIIPEDFRKDQYILGPVVQKMVEAIDKPRAKVRMCLDPLLGGVIDSHISNACGIGRSDPCHMFRKNS